MATSSIKNNFRNIVGTDFPPYVNDQLEFRKKLVNKNTRNKKEILWLTNKTGWYRVSSLALIKNSDTLAKSNILQGGTVIRNEGNTTTLRKGFNQTYTKGPLGYKPMPGILNMSISTGGRWQSLLEGEFEFIVYDLTQLEDFSRLYMSLGVHLFIEWGHMPYINSSGAIETSNIIKPLDIYDDIKYKTRVDVLREISKKKKNLHGNYEALLGRVYNFDYSANSDGSYTCKVKVMGPGGMVDAIKASRGQGYDNDQTESDEPPKYSTDLQNALTSIHQAAFNILKPTKNKPSTAGTQTYDSGIRAYGEFKFLGSNDFFKTTEIKQDFFGFDYFKQPSLGKTLNSIYDFARSNFSFSQSGEAGVVNFDKGTFGQLAKYGNAHQIVSKIFEEGEGGTVDSIASSLGIEELNIDNFFKAYSTTLMTGEKNSSYITLGHLFCLVQNICVYKEGENQDSKIPLILIDHQPNNVIMRRGIIDASIDHSICLVPFGSQFNLQKSYRNLLKPLDLNREETYPFKNNGPEFTNNKLNIANQNLQLDRISNNIEPKLVDANGNARLFNVLINVHFAIEKLDTLKRNKADRNVAIREYLQSILDGVNRSLGGLNNFKINFDDCSQVLRVIDLNHVPETLEYIEIPSFGKKSLAYEYNYSSKITKELAAQVVIASQAEDKGIENLPDDVLSYHRLNGGVTDRFTKSVTDSDNSNTPTSTLSAILSTTATAQTGTAQPTINFGSPKKKDDSRAIRGPLSLYYQLYNIYSLAEEGKINQSISDSLINMYSDRQMQSLNQSNPSTDKNHKIGILMPLEMSITMDGISGILPYSAFLLPNDRLPPRYRNRVAFIVFSINHELDNNQWKVTLRGQTIMRPDTDTSVITN